MYGVVEQYTKASIEAFHPLGRSVVQNRSKVLCHAYECIPIRVLLLYIMLKSKSDLASLAQSFVLAIEIWLGDAGPPWMDVCDNLSLLLHRVCEGRRKREGEAGRERGSLTSLLTFSIPLCILIHTMYCSTLCASLRSYTTAQ